MHRRFFLPHYAEVLIYSKKLWLAEEERAHALAHPVYIFSYSGNRFAAAI